MQLDGQEYNYVVLFDNVSYMITEDGNANINTLPYTWVKLHYPL